MKKKMLKSKLVYYLMLFLAFLIPYLDYKNFILNLWANQYYLGIVNSSSNLIQTWLLVVGAWVAYETLKLRRLTSKQIQIQIAPVLVVYFRENPERITVRNIGNGVAFDVKFEKITIFLEDIEKEANYDLGIYSPPVLTPEEERKVQGSMYLDGKEISKNITRSGDGTVWLIPKYANADFEFIISYFDMQGDKYGSKVSAGKKGVKLISYKKAS
jgi:hypothetical protein